MIKKLVSPIFVPLFGSCDCIVIEARDNFTDTLDVNFCLGKLLVPSHVTREVVQGGKIVAIAEKQPPQFVSSPVQGSVKIDGDDYQKWDRTPDALSALIQSKVPELCVGRENAMPAQ